jgi:sugar/nucleoside kinase (ribokinase family)
MLVQVNWNLVADSLPEVQRFLMEKPEEFSVVVMPDFFLDRVVSIGSDVKTFCGELVSVARRKGGSIDGIGQADIRGGNAMNTASALAALDANVTPIVCTSGFGLRLLKFHLRHQTLDLSRVKVASKASITTAVEFAAGEEKINVMLRDVGSLADFGPESLNDEDWKAIEKADYVCVFNWAGTRRFGTELAKAVFHRVKTKGRGRIYYDTADPMINEAGIPELARMVLLGRHLDVLSVNENEAVCFAAQLDDGFRGLRESLRLEEVAQKAAGILASRLRARVDLHATGYSATFTKGGKLIVPAFDVAPLRATGAGDAWNAGNILGEAGGLSDECRLMLANAVAAYYISSPAGTHPTRRQLAEFCKKAKLKKRA